MAKRKRFIKQTEIGLFDKSARLQQVQSMENTLKQTSLIMDCEIFLPVLDRIPTAVPKGPGGRPPFHPCSCSRFLFCSPSKAFPTNRPNIRFSTAADTVPDQNTIRGFRETLTRSEVTNASVHNSQVLDAVTREGNPETWLDVGYVGAACEEVLKNKGISAKICEKGARNRPLTAKQKRSNRAKSRKRSRVEHVFGYMTMSMKAMVKR